MGIFSNTSNFDVLVDKATSQLLLEPDWDSILQICDYIRQEDVIPKYAVAIMKRKIYDKNPHVARYGLIVLEACVKNCGAPMHKEVATKDMMDSFRELAKSSPEPVKEQILSMIQTWSIAFRKEPKYKIVQDTFNLMRMEGYKFPSVNESSDALFTAETAPEWAEGDVCHMCRVKFSTFQRQHHCRNCGQVFCQKCSSRVSIIPQYGIEREVRVCDPCFYKLNPSASKSEEGSKKSESASSDKDLPPEYLNSPLSRESQTPAKKTAKEIQEEEEEELQLALALSLSQEEAAKDSRQRPSTKSNEAREPSYSSYRQTSNLYSSPMDDVVTDSASVDPELARYLNRSYWEERNERQTSKIRSSVPASVQGQREELNEYSDKDDHETSETTSEVSDAMVKNFHSSVEMLLERMQKVSGQGKHIAMDATVQSLFQTVSAMHPQILRFIEQLEEETAKYEALQVKVGLVRETRSSLDEMREQHREKVRQQELEQDMLRRMQIEQKLELMRQQKAEYLAYQQRLQAERQTAIEQQQQQRPQYQRPMQMQQYQYPPAGDSSPYSSLNYLPVTVASSQPYTSQNTSAVPQGYQVPDAPLPSQYPTHSPPSAYSQAYRSELMPYRNDAPTSQAEPQPQPSSLEYQPPTYASQVQPDQGPASLQSYSLGGPSPVPTAPAQVIAQAPPPQYAQVTSQQPSSQQPYGGQLGNQQPPPQTTPLNQYPVVMPPSLTGQPKMNPIPPSQNQPQFSRQTQLASTGPHLPEATPSQLTNPPQAQFLPEGVASQYTHPASQVTQPKPQTFQSPEINGFPSVDASQIPPQMFSSGSLQPQLNMGQSSFQQGPLIQQGQPGGNPLQGSSAQQGPPIQQGPPMQQVYEPQQQQPQQFAPQQGYQPGPGQGPPGQQQPPPQYYGSALPPQQSNQAPQRQLSDLELISFD
ncbi:hepatocyte growth factor-regulated tyrosine kinase substrate-like isoform X2 [Acropora muricata]|uniref:hepatocyte growth factor-regulated tyrosine kinase substrate-like isoform X2 n=1 Tax=Acropora muricata TaxID=159855 RepID=UPI0034E562A6